MSLQVLLEIINANFSVPFWFIFFALLAEDWRFSRRTMRILLPSVLVLLCLAQGLIFCLVKDFFLSRLLMMANSCLWGLTFSLSTTNYRGGRILFISLTNFSLLLIGGVFSECVGNSSTLNRLLIKIGINLLVVLFIFVLFRPTLRRLLKEDALDWYRLALLPLTFAVSLLVLLIPGRLRSDPELQFLAITLTIALVVCYAVLYQIFRALKDRYALRADNELLRSQMTALQTQAATLQSAYNQVRIFRHDMRHYMLLQSSCLESGDLEHARQLLASMQENLDSGLESWAIRCYTGKPLLDAVLSNYAARCEKHGIDLTLDFTLPETLPAPADELAVVLANALENAFHACRRIPPDRCREIRLLGVTTGAQFLLAVVNTYTGVVELDLLTGHPVTHEAGHGYGTQSIAAFAKRYGATLDYVLKDGRFSLRLLF